MTGSFQLNILARILLILIAGIYTGIVISAGKPVHILFTMILIVSIQVVNLVWYINKVNKTITYFFDAVRNEDHSLAFPQHGGDKTLSGLSNNLKRINDMIQNIHIENRRQEQYFGALIEHVGTGIMSCNKDGFVLHANSSLKKLLGMKQFTHIRQLEKIDPNLARAIYNTERQDETLITINGKNGTITLLVKASAFKSKEQKITLISMQDIKKELDEKELDSWLKLIRVLTHEIMNSIAPVTSLSENLCSYFVRKGEAISAEEVDAKIIDVTIRGLNIIHEQGQGLTRFVESYRKLTRLPEPEKSVVRIYDLLEKTAMLCKSFLPCSAIDISFSTENRGLVVNIDENQISQVLINLLKNSAEALHNTPDPRISMHGRKNSRGQVEISVADNGPGIPPELIDEIFVPFFTTNETGSGIGLSLSRQILRLHNGSLKVRSVQNRETVFTMLFN